jgi:chromosome segregation ATPase
MTRIFIIVTIVVLAGLLSGCSVFGVATRSELEAAVQQQSAARERTEGRVEDLADDLESLERTLRPRLASLDSALVRTTAEVAMVTERWEGLRTTMASELDTLASNQEQVWLQLSRVRNGLATAQEQLGLARDDLDVVSDLTDLAGRRSQRALTLHADGLRWERDRLRDRLVALERRLQDLDRALADSAAAASADSVGGKIEIRDVSLR